MAAKKSGTGKNPGDAIDDQLARYRSMRDFGATAEPSGKSTKRKAGTPANNKAVLPFVVQKHAATRLHYDFRLGWHGVLKSWAVAKGPSYDTHDRRLAVQVEDHPMEYGGFEGLIPRGQYGGGTVMVWDQGTWEPHVDVDEGLRKGSLKFALNGTKLHGNWTLVRMGGHAAQEGKPNWLLIKEHDEFERGPGDACITEEKPNSTVTGRTLEQIADAATHVWNSKETANEEGHAWYRQRARAADAASNNGKVPVGASDITEDDQTSTKASRSAHRSKAQRAAPYQPGPTAQVPPAERNQAPTARSINPENLKRLPKESLPSFLKPQLAAEVESPPSGTDWLHEIKLDGYRIQARKHGSKVELLTRTGLDWTHRMKPLAAAVARIPAENAILDGEVVVLDGKGLSSFANLQASFERGESHPLTYFVFDLLHADGHNTRDLPLRERKAMLRTVIDHDAADLRFADHLTGNGEAVFHKACELHAEGIISKRATAKYTAGRSAAWFKSKCLHEQEFVIGGWKDLSNGQRGIGSLLLGYYDGAGKLIYAGKTGTGYTQKTHRSLRDLLEPLEQKASPFQAVPTEGCRGAHFVKPQQVAQVRFATWTAENQLRQAAYLGLREDKPAKDVRKEEAAPAKRDRHVSANATGKSRISSEHDPGVPHPSATPSRKGGVSAATKDSAKAVTSMPAIRLTHPQKIVDPESGTTKQQLAAYLFAVSERMLPHIADRPLSLVRCPEGAGKPCFYQKHVNHMLPAGAGSVMVSDKKGGPPAPYITLNSVEALTGLAQMTVLEIHPWGSCNAHLETPDRITIDLDPDESLPWERVAESAVEVRNLLKKLGLTSFVKTTGGKGLHIVFPLRPEHDFRTMKAWAHGFVQGMERDDPKLYLTKMTKAARTGKIYLDYLRNERGATAVAPYSMRARAGLPVSVPLDWQELETRARPVFSVSTFSAWQSRLKRDPWKPMGTLRQSLSQELVERFAGANKT